MENVTSLFSFYLDYLNPKQKLNDITQNLTTSGIQKIRKLAGSQENRTVPLFGVTKKFYIVIIFCHDNHHAHLNTIYFYSREILHLQCRFYTNTCCKLKTYRGTVILLSS